MFCLKILILHKKMLPFKLKICPKFAAMHVHSKNELKTALAIPGTEMNAFLYLAFAYL